MKSKKIKSEFHFDRQVLNLTLNNPPGNVLDIEMISELTQALQDIGNQSQVKAIVFAGVGDNFSYGASIPEHTKELAGKLLSTFHQFFRTFIKISKPTLALVRGKCLGGGLELAAFCNWIFASENAIFGQPEIKLAVFPPIASLILPHRIGQSSADDLILTGRSISAQEAKAMALVHSVSADPAKDLQELIASYILPKSTVALHYSVQSSRLEMHKAFLNNIDEIEKLYVRDLMCAEDPNEGIAAFIEKREPRWKNQ